MRRARAAIHACCAAASAAALLYPPVAWIDGTDSGHVAWRYALCGPWPPARLVIWPVTTALLCLEIGGIAAAGWLAWAAADRLRADAGPRCRDTGATHRTMER